ncbi:MFS transporter [Streptomyces chumphonensis]|uniref:MFS transporter n=1 Tax=Streptomyces chumphonensis TaxID=1214925 RepID=A0A927F0B4_9ACTN|nr:MFS transporter [Streptomyces chumphonensis]MBD3933048.1 MFS transporter [Streptomyces chumphonensis]
MTTATGATLRRIQLGNALSAFGSGFTVPYLFIYVADVRELGPSMAGAVLAVFAAAALLVLPLVGRVIDRRGPLPVALTGTGAAAVGASGFGLTEQAATVLTAAAVLGAGVAVLQPALATMIVWCSTTETRSRAFATQFFLINLGMGAGGLLGGLIVDEHAPASFTLLFSIQAVMFLVLGGVLWTVRVPRAPVLGDPPTADGQAPAASGWRALLEDRAMVLLGVLGFVLFFTCYGQFESGLAAYGVEVTGISTSTLGLALFANTVVIMLAQFVVLRMVHGRRRSRVVALVGVVWAVAWLSAGASGLVPQTPALAVTLFISTYALFGLGEAMLSPTVAPLVADLAPQPMVGRYNSAFALVKQLGVAVGPAVGGLMAAQGAYPAYIALLVMCSLGIALLALRLGRRLTPVQDDPALRVTQVVLRSPQPGGPGPAGQPVGVTV